MRSAAVVAIGRVHHDAPNAPTRVAEHLALTAIDALVRVQSPLLTQPWGQFDTLRVYQRQRRRGQSPLCQAVRAVAGVTQALKRAVCPPPGKVLIDCRPGGKTGRQVAPLAPSPADIQHGVKDLP